MLRPRRLKIVDIQVFPLKIRIAIVIGNATQAIKTVNKFYCEILALIATVNAPLTSLLSSTERLIKRKISAELSILTALNHFD